MNKPLIYSDKELLKAVRENGTAGWDLFCRQYDPMIQSIARWPKWHFSEDEQNDVCQNIHMSLHSALQNFRQESSLAWFVKRIAMRQCINEIRRQKRWRTYMTSSTQKDSSGDWSEIDFATPDALDPYHEVAQEERLEMLRSAIQHLNATCKDSISMFYLQRCSYKEMSKKLGIAVNTVGSRLSKCLNKLHDELKKYHLFERTNP